MPAGLGFSAQTTNGPSKLKGCAGGVGGDTGSGVGSLMGECNRDGRGRRGWSLIYRLPLRCGFPNRGNRRRVRYKVCLSCTTSSFIGLASIILREAASSPSPAASLPAQQQWQTGGVYGIG
ncbi:hypothetical protein Tco_1253721 [Tanacetum coccineum]|uniref:Uncharacterized protein n=1 Tax=Tanacetum coccineum TaxID=301880 RepID=A0ABQ4WS08_9ASTR